MSLINRLEADFVIDIVRALQESFGYENLRNKVGVITPYAKQVKHISRQIEAAVNEGPPGIEFGAALENACSEAFAALRPFSSEATAPRPRA